MPDDSFLCKDDYNAQQQQRNGGSNNNGGVGRYSVRDDSL